ncbi:MAG: hypothetical protein CFE23_15965 [Flavobacterium sp. BFFFF1]|uniref:SIMPL domain-containing protein n=1 Tax=unclassified Flavobacterium TaxID=196869 RepID=UPI000BD4F5EC|nr:MULTISPECIES: SIMPL domain-containing protein [unclassified Flavobacterium]OYU79040.1 MAG: hypothetical protein CFE23_15965 [Flavobacterium sp. BFFFF1]
MKTTFAITAFLMLNVCLAQHAGNELYGNNDYNRAIDNQLIHNASADKIVDNGQTLVYHINILDHVEADTYLVTLGLNQEGLNPKECNEKINQRIEGFRSELKKLGLKATDIYVDFISQTKIYDYKIKTQGSQTTSTQEQKGFELKKNIILRLEKMSLFDKIIETASEFEIFNIVKVDYLCKDPKKIYNAMLNEANKVLAERKAMNKDADNPDEYGKPRVSINYYSVQPGNQYKAYTAYESSDVSYYNEYRSDATFIKQEQRKSKTFYYDGRQPDFYDSILNAETPVVGLQYVMEMVVTYTHR